VLRSASRGGYHERRYLVFTGGFLRSSRSNHVPSSSWRARYTPGLRQRPLLCLLGAIVVAAPRKVQHPADHADRILPRQGHADLPASAPRCSQDAGGFFSTSISSACRSTRRSSSAIRARSWLPPSSPWKTRAARSRKWAFQVESNGAPMPYWRQTSALLLWPLSTSKDYFGLELGTEGATSRHVPLLSEPRTLFLSHVSSLRGALQLAVDPSHQLLSEVPCIALNWLVVVGIIVLIRRFVVSQICRPFYCLLWIVY